MKNNIKFAGIAVTFCMAMMSEGAWAGDSMLSLATPSARFYTPEIRSYMLAENAQEAPQGTSATMATPAQYEPPLWTTGNAHKYLGLGTLALVAATALAPKPGECESASCPPVVDTSGPHQTLGRAAAAMAAATVVSGLMFHWNDVHIADGLTDPDNLHALLGTAGALLMLAAVSTAPAGGHAGEGILGGVAMGAAVKITW